MIFCFYFYDLVFLFDLRRCGLRCGFAVCDAVLRCCGCSVAVAVLRFKSCGLVAVAVCGLRLRLRLRPAFRGMEHSNKWDPSERFFKEPLLWGINRSI